MIKEKNMAKENTSSSGIGFFGLLTILFIGLKLTGFINWSWWYVLMPIWGAIAFGLILFLIIILIGYFVTFLDRRKTRI